MVLVFEHITTKRTSFKGLAIHHFNDEGKCYACVPYHHSAKFAPTQAVHHVQHRINKIPIRPDAMPKIVEIARSAAFQATMTWDGFLGVDVYKAAEADVMYTHSRWASEEFADAAAAALASVLKGFLMEHIAAKPEPSVGPLGISYHAELAAASLTTARITTFTLKPGTYSAAMAYMHTQTETFKTIEGLGSVEAVNAGGDKVVVVAKYPSMELLEKATARIKKLMGGMEEMFAAPPEQLLASIEYKFEPPAASA